MRGRATNGSDAAVSIANRCVPSSAAVSNALWVRAPAPTTASARLPDPPCPPRAGRGSRPLRPSALPYSAPAESPGVHQPEVRLISVPAVAHREGE